MSKARAVDKMLKFNGGLQELGKGQGETKRPSLSTTMLGFAVLKGYKKLAHQQENGKNLSEQCNIEQHGSIILYMV